VVSGRMAFVIGGIITPMALITRCLD